MPYILKRGEYHVMQGVFSSTYFRSYFFRSDLIRSYPINNFSSYHISSNLIRSDLIQSDPISGRERTQNISKHETDILQTTDEMR